MRKRIFLFLLLLIVMCCTVYAHPGRTDGAGGHTNHYTGEYHYHHGMSEHQHPNGICPYDDRYSNYAIIEKDREDDYEEEDNSIQTLEEYCEENGIELSPKKSDESSEEDSIIFLFLEITLIVIGLRWLYKLYNKHKKGE